MFETVDGEEAKHFSETLDYRAYQACLQTAQLNLPFSGYGKQIRGLAPFAAKWLTGDKTVLSLLTPEDIGWKGGPILITNPDRAGDFRNKLIWRLSQAGARIVKAGFHPDVLQVENDLTNQLVNQYVRSNIVPFAQGGDSHIDFIRLNGRLYLDIQVAQKS